MATRLAELDIDLTTRGHLERGMEHLSDEFAGVHVRSAGSDPADRINPHVVIAMAELGLASDAADVRRIRTDIEERARHLLAELTIPAGTAG